MTEHQPPPPSLPTNVLEHILAIIPHFDVSNQDPIYSLLNVLPQATVPTVYASLVVNTFAYPNRPTAAPMSSALKRLFSVGYSFVPKNLLLSRVREALADFNDCRDAITLAIVQAGNVESLEYLAALERVTLADCEHVVHEAASHGSVDILRWWVANRLPLDALDRSSIEAAAKHGYIEVLKWWRSLDPPVAFDFMDSTIIADVVASGHLNVLRWLKGLMPPEQFVFNKEHWILASMNGHCAILQHAKRNSYGFPDSTADCIDAAAGNGHIGVLDWWYQNIDRKLALSYTVDAMDGASAAGHVDVLDWFMQSGLELRFTPAALRLAHENGHAVVVEWWGKCRLFNNMVAGLRCPINVHTPSDFVMLCAFGLLDSLSAPIVAKQSRPTLDHALRVACQHGQVNVLNLLAPLCDSKSLAFSHFEHAIEYNQVAALQWCFRHPPRTLPGIDSWLQCVKLAFERGHVEVMQLLNAARLLSWDSYQTDYVQAACQGGQIRSLKFLDMVMESPNEWTSELCASAVTAASARGHVAVLDWLLEQGVDFEQFDSTGAISASANGHAAVLQWWCGNSLPFQFTELALWDAVRNQHERVIHWWIGSGKVVGQFMLEMHQSLPGWGHRRR